MLKRMSLIALIFLFAFPTVVFAQATNPQYSPLYLLFPSEETQVYGRNKITSVVPGMEINTFVAVGNPFSDVPMQIHVKIDGNITNWVTANPITVNLEPHMNDSSYWSEKINITIKIPKECDGATLGFDGLTYSQSDWDEYEVPSGKYASNWLPITPCVQRGKWYGNMTKYSEGPYAGQGRWEAIVLLSPEVPAMTGMGQSIILASGIPIRIHIADYNSWEYVNLPTVFILSILQWVILIVVLAIGIPTYFFYIRPKFKQPTQQE